MPSCRPGHYLHDSLIRGHREHHIERDRDREWSDNEAFYEPMPSLQWPMDPMIVDGQAIPPPTAAISHDRCRQCQRYIAETGTDRASWMVEGFCMDCRAMQQTAQRNRQEIASIYGVPGAIMAALSPNQIRRREGLPELPGIVGASGTRLPGFEDRLVAARYGPAIKPEQEIIDEIDRLVNESIRPGPRDDYSVNRYPKCEHCNHDWHGIVCNNCACLGETGRSDIGG